MPKRTKRGSSGGRAKKKVKKDDPLASSGISPRAAISNPTRSSRSPAHNRTHVISQLQHYRASSSFFPHQSVHPPLLHHHPHHLLLPLLLPSPPPHLRGLPHDALQPPFKRLQRLRNSSLRAALHDLLVLRIDER